MINRLITTGVVTPPRHPKKQLWSSPVGLLLVLCLSLALWAVIWTALAIVYRAIFG